jgi:hypothetical protein
MSNKIIGTLKKNRKHCICKERENWGTMDAMERPILTLLQLDRTNVTMGRVLTRFMTTLTVLK